MDLVIHEKNCFAIAVLNWSWGLSVRFYKVSAVILFLPQVEITKSLYKTLCMAELFCL